MHPFSYIATTAEEKKIIETYQFYLGLVRQRIDFWFCFFVLENRKLTFSYPGETDKLYRVASNCTEKENGCKFPLEC